MNKEFYIVEIKSSNKKENTIEYHVEDYTEATEIMKKYLDKGYYATIYNLSHAFIDDKEMNDIISDFMYKVQSDPDNADIYRGYLNSLFW